MGRNRYSDGDGYHVVASMMKNMFISEFTRMIFTLEMKHFMFRLIRHQNQEAQHATV